MKNRKELIVVLGMHRSGTSAITRGLQVLGVSLGERLIPPIEGNNSKGFWEDIEINAFDNEILYSIGSDWFYLSPVEAHHINQLHDTGYFLRAVELLRKKVAGTEIFAFKDPRVTKLLPFWKEVFRHCQIDVNYVLALRHPLSVVKSLAKRDCFAAEHGYLLWLGHTLESLIGSAGKNRVLVDYDRMMQSPDHELSRMATAFGLVIDSEELRKYKVDFLDQSLRHTKYIYEDLLMDSSCPEIIREVYRELMDVASGSVAIDSNELAVQISRWWCELERMKPFLLLVDKLLSQKLDLARLASERDEQIASLSQAVTERDEQIASLSQAVTEREIIIENLLQSNSWRITAPLRKIGAMLNKDT